MMNSKHPSIAFIGAGNMAKSIISGLINNEYAPEAIWATNPSSDKLQYLHQHYNIQISNDNITAANHAEVIVLAVKPQVLHDVANELVTVIQQRRPLVISIAAGITTEMLNRWLGENLAIIRCMPNIAALVNSSATSLYANKQVSTLQRSIGESIMRAVGITLWIDDEKQMDIVSALAGSGPAYFFYMMEALESAAVQLGLNQADAHLLVLQTILGSARIAMSSNEATAELRQHVTSKGGITECAINLLESRQAREIFSQALTAAYQRSREIAGCFL